MKYFYTFAVDVQGVTVPALRKDPPWIYSRLSAACKMDKKTKRCYF